MQVLDVYATLPKPQQRVTTLLQLLTDRKHQE
jgi:hypothetical protein